MEGKPTYTEPVSKPSYTVESYSAVALPTMEPFEERVENDNDQRRP